MNKLAVSPDFFRFLIASYGLNIEKGQHHSKTIYQNHSIGA